MDVLNQRYDKVKMHIDGEYGKMNVAAKYVQRYMVDKDMDEKKANLTIELWAQCGQGYGCYKKMDSIPSLHQHMVQ